MENKKSDLFWQLSHDFVKIILDRSLKQKHETGYILFREGDPARCFYTLIKGHIQLVIGDNRQMVHTR